MLPKPILGLFVGVCALIPSNGALAGGADENFYVTRQTADTLSVSVSFEDLDLAVPAHRRVLSDRIDLAARQVCRELIHTRFLVDRIMCQSEAVYGAQDQVHRAELQAKAGLRAESTRVILVSNAK